MTTLDAVDVALFSLRALNVSDRDAHPGDLLAVYERLEDDPFVFDASSLPADKAELVDVLRTLENRRQVVHAVEQPAALTTPGIHTLEDVIDSADADQLDALIDALREAYGVTHFDGARHADDVDAATRRLKDRLEGIDP